MNRYLRIVAAVGLAASLLGIGVVATGAEVIDELIEESVIFTPDSGSLGVYPHLVNCRRCHVVRRVDTGNRTGDGTGEIISEHARCRCDVEFRVDRIPNPPAMPCPGL